MCTKKMYKCHRCGYEWEHGKSGVHSCADYLYEDAMRWRALIDSERLRFIGSARLGQNGQLICIEFHSDCPVEDMTKEEKEGTLEWLIKYVDHRRESKKED